MSESKFDVVVRPGIGVPIKAWTRGVEFDENSKQQLLNVAQMPFIYKWIAAMPDAHLGYGACNGSVIPTRGAIIPAAVGVDIGCGMMAVKTSLTAFDLPDNLLGVRTDIEKAVPHGRSDHGGSNDRGGWAHPPNDVVSEWHEMTAEFNSIVDKHPEVEKANHLKHLGTLGTGNHFIELCLDEHDYVWVMLHSGSRGVGNRIGTYFIRLAREDTKKWFINLPDKDLGYFPRKTEHFKDYIQAVSWAQNYALVNRKLMMRHALKALTGSKGIPPFEVESGAVNCHHNYVAIENHFGENIFVTRKGAVRAREGDMGIIPGSMGAKSYIVRGLGNPDSFHSCSHGAGRVMSRKEAKRRFTVEDHQKATEGVECRKDAEVIDETPAAYKSIDAVMKAQEDLVEVVHTLKQVVCVKG